MNALRKSKPTLLLVDDDAFITDALAHVLNGKFTLHIAASRAEANTLLDSLEIPPQLALVDLGLPPVPDRPDEGFRLIVDLLARDPSIKVIVLSGQDEDDNAKHARTIGAIDFISKPCEFEELSALLENVLEAHDKEHVEVNSSSGIVGESLPCQKLREQIVQYAEAPFPVLIEGESGCGKELVASSLHNSSSRREQTFFTLNCAAITSTLLESTLFGAAKGAFTGAISTRSGYFEDAENSTLFLDEIGELGLEMQAKLLRVLENGEFQRVGETKSRYSNARILVATNRDLRKDVKTGRFRADLFHRIAVFSIHVPPLRSLDNDKCLLLAYFRKFYATQETKRFMLDEQAMELWSSYSFPGNVRELRNIVIRLSAKYPGKSISREKLLPELDAESEIEVDESRKPASGDVQSMMEAAKEQLRLKRQINLDAMLQQYEQGYVEAAMEITNGNLSQAAKILGIQRSTLYSRMRRYE